MNSNEKKNYYEVLEIQPHVTHQEIQNAYNRARNAYSGDSAALYSLMSQDTCDQILEQIEEAYLILGAPEKRREYDKARGLNQSHTPEGFEEEMSQRPDYKPSQSISDLLSDSQSRQQQELVKQNAMKEEFTYQQEHSQRNEVTVSKVQAVKRFGLSFESDTNFEQEIENCTQYSGEFLKKIRDYKKVTIERMAEMTRISKTYIRNIESDDFTKLPADVYTRGFVYQYAKCLKLNPDLVANSYINHLKTLKNPA